jgi:3-hydroxy-5-phosphonooxypentane-2,4-dione thiolase
MDWGLKNRLNRIIRPESGHVVMLAVDHGYFLGPITKLEQPGETVDPLLPYADALMLARGVLRNCIPAETDTPMVLRVSGGRSILAGEDLSDEGLATSMEDAVRLNASAVALSIFVGSRHEKQTILNLARLVDEGERCGMPVLAVTAVGKELAKRDARYLGLACRIAAEFGAHFVKTYHCDDFEEVVESCPVPIVIAGGPKLDTEMDVFRMARTAIDQGAVGVDMGRNIWQNANAVAMIRAVRGIVHDGLTPEDAHDLFDDLSAETAD